MSRRALARCAAVLAVGAVLAACSSSNSPTKATEATTPALATTTTQRPSDGVLRLGVLLPREGVGAELGQSMTAGVTVAVNEINAAGGVMGSKVQVVTQPEGVNPAATAQAVNDLLTAGVDAIVGPASSTDALAVMASIVNTGVVDCSPTASALALDQFPDDGRFFRTIPSDSLQSVAIAESVVQTGSTSATVAYVDDAYGRPFASDVQVALRARGVTVTRSVPFTSSDASIGAAARDIASDHPEMVVVIGDPTAGPDLLERTDAGMGGARPMYVVNDTMRRPAASDQNFTPPLTSRIIGVSPLAESGDSTFVAKLLAVDPQAVDLYAHNAYDCVNLIALAAETVGGTDPDDIASGMVPASSSGSTCATFPACKALLDSGLNIDYDGPTGALDLGQNGDPSRAVFDIFHFDDTGRDISTRHVVVSGT